MLKKIITVVMIIVISLIIAIYYFFFDMDRLAEDSRIADKSSPDGTSTGTIGKRKL